MAGRKNRGRMLAIYAPAERKEVSPLKVIDEVINTHPVYLSPPPRVRSQPRNRLVNGQYWPWPGVCHDLNGHDAVRKPGRVQLASATPCSGRLKSAGPAPAGFLLTVSA
jgi:hypothetical protein